MTLDHPLLLFRQAHDFDAVGNHLAGPEETTEILCHVASVTRTEHYRAANNGVQVELQFTVHAFEYAGERFAGFDGRRYEVERTYHVPGTEHLELIVKAVEQDGTAAQEIPDQNRRSDGCSA